MIRVDGIRSELKLRLEKVKESLRSHDEDWCKNENELLRKWTARISATSKSLIYLRLLCYCTL